MTRTTASTSIPRLVLILIGTYLAGWFVLFSILTGFDYQYLLPYFAYSWSGGFELPAFIQLGAIAVTVLAGVVLCIRAVLRGRAG
jgi:hypothetical protein